MKFKEIPNLPPRLNQKIQALESEKDDAYAADELVELGEEILSQLAAMGIAVYLQQAKQKDVFNDFLISLFLSNGHAYNAGPLYRWAANMIKDAEGTDAELLKPFFWEKDDGKEILNKTIHHLAGLRNAVMHGFFVLPPERNREEAQKMEHILNQLQSAELFTSHFGSFHFMDKDGFNGHWNISTVESWNLFDLHFPFGKLAERVAHEYAPSFRAEEDQFTSESNTPVDQLQEEMQQLLEKGKGALISWYRPGSEMGQQAYRTFVQTLDNNVYFPIYFALHSKGATFTASFLEQELGKGLHRLTSDDKALKDPFKFLKAQKDNLAKKPVIILHDVHLALFSPNHLTNLFNALYDLDVPVLATAWHYPYLKRFFNASVNLNEAGTKTEEQVLFSLENYLRFKGPNAEQADDKKDFELLKRITLDLFERLEMNQEIVARRYADQHEFPIEFVHEAFNILSPFYNMKSEQFKEDELDELYGFPKTIEESSRIFLTLGRRDVKLEYQHKVLIKKQKV
ncbi:MAG: hypothetical protein NTY55_12290 [Flavobacteriia bacterium]|nr:hypothetical protein [Flavobacteriia bacterium]